MRRNSRGFYPGSLGKRDYDASLDSLRRGDEWGIPLFNEPEEEEEQEDEEEVVYEEPVEQFEYGYGNRPSRSVITPPLYTDYASYIPPLSLEHIDFYRYFTPVFVNIIRYFMGIILGKPRTGKTLFAQELIRLLVSDKQGLYSDVKIIAAIPSVWDEFKKSSELPCRIQLLSLTKKLPENETEKEKKERRREKKDTLILEIIEARQREVEAAKRMGTEPTGLVLVFDDLAPQLASVQEKLEDIVIATANFRTTILIISQDMYLVPPKIRQAADLIAVTGLKGGGPNFLRDLKSYVTFSSPQMERLFLKVLALLTKNKEMVVIKNGKTVETNKKQVKVSEDTLDWHASLSYYILDKPFIQDT
jgi:hypothetical protein